MPQIIRYGGQPDASCGYNSVFRDRCVKSLKLNGLTPDQTAVAVDVISNLRRLPVGEHYFVVPFSHRQVNLLADDARIRREAKQKGISVEIHWIAPHKVDKRWHRRVKFTSKDRLYLPLTAVFVFPTWRDQFFFKIWFV